MPPPCSAHPGEVKVGPDRERTVCGQSSLEPGWATLDPDGTTRLLTSVYASRYPSSSIRVRGELQSGCLPPPACPRKSKGEAEAQARRGLICVGGACGLERFPWPLPSCLRTWLSELKGRVQKP